MFEIKGKYATAKVFTDNCEDEAVSQIAEVLNDSAFDGCKVRIMPDVHSGKGITIGFSSTINGYVNPDFVGCDIGCGVESIFFDRPLDEKDYPLFEHRVRNAVPMGCNLHEHTVIDEKDFVKFLNNEVQKLYNMSGAKFNFIQFSCPDDVDKWFKKFGMQSNVFWHSLGTLGSGNHFEEYGVGSEHTWDGDKGHYVFTVHTGSRNLGIKVHSYWRKVAMGDKTHKKEIKSITAEAKKEYSAMHNGNMVGFDNYVAKKIENFKASLHVGYLSGDALMDYLTDMVVCQLYAAYNRKTILNRVADIMHKINGANVINKIASVHNYIDMSDNIIRKGSIRSYCNELMIIPFNMRDGLAICEGKSNDDWNCTAPHGSGRALSRTKSREQLNVEDFKKEMADAGIYTTTASNETLDEAPEAYKNTESVLKDIEDTCSIKFFVKPKINIKAGGRD